MSEKLILLKESVIGSWAKDAGTFAVLGGLPFFNHAYCGGSGWINAAIAFAWLISIISRASGTKKQAEKTPAELRAWLDENYPVQAPTPRENAA